MIFISAGHHLRDSGAIGSGTQENLETIKFRDLVCSFLTSLGVAFKKDNDNETLQEYFDRIKTGDGSVVLEFHFDSSGTGKAGGTTALVGNDADRLDKAFAKELADTTSFILGVKNRGVKPESQSHRGRLRIMRESGTVCLLEVCFIDNIEDMILYNQKKEILANSIANILARYEALV